MSFQSEEDLSCPVCYDIFRHPVILSCNHSFCKMCLKNWWAQKMEQQCPVCKKISEQSDPPCNSALKTLAEACLQEREPSASVGSEVLCSLHHEKLKLFCLDHQEPACVVCRDLRAHVDHKFKPIDEVVQDHKEELQKSLKPLQDKLKVLQKVKGNFDITEQRIKFQDQHIEKQIKEQFKKFHQFLHEEEKVRLAALKKEEQQKSQKIREKIAALSREIPALLQTMRVAEEVLRAKDVSFLQDYRAALKMVQQYPSIDDPQLVAEALIDVAKHLGNLTYTIWNKMKGVASYAPGTHPELSVSKDLTSERHQLPDKPERFWILSTHDAGRVRASGPGLTSSVSATFPVEFNIDVKDAGQGQLSVLITEQGGEHKQANIHDNCDGTYRVSYVPDRAGWYTIVIKYGGDDIPGSPYSVHATSTDAASSCDMSGPDMHPAFGEELCLYPISLAAPLEEHSPHLPHVVRLYGLQQDHEAR